ncbi:MAG TPA: enoyl-CoA hydratase/isomerase family protein [candidate division UBP10 bacterium]|nr:enoyl-CoA hydratase/isomerase family protein [Candidatus Binatota bacterium]
MADPTGVRLYTLLLERYWNTFYPSVGRANRGSKAVADDSYKYQAQGGVGVITLNRPKKLNPIDWDLSEALCGLFRRLREDDDIRAIVLTGAGRGFSAGGDAEWLSGKAERVIPGISPREREQDMPRYQRKTPVGPIGEVVRWIFDVDKPVIAALHGPVMGAGLAFALACDRRFADPSTQMCAAMVRLGFAPDCGVSWLLPRVTSLSTSLRMVTTGDILLADECKAEGLIDELVEEGGALEAATAYAARYAQAPAVGVELARRFVHRSLTARLDEMIEYEAAHAVLSAHTHDAPEGTSAFVEKRKPGFKGH